MSGWRLAKSLEVLRAELNTLAPKRSKAADGTIGDAAHAASASGHNPNKDGVVTSFDATHDPAGGCDIHRLVREVILKHPHPNLHYVISAGRIFNRDIGPWKDRPYSGADPHQGHAHFSVGTGTDAAPTGPYDDTSPWGLLAASASIPAYNPTEDSMDFITTPEKPQRIVARIGDKLVYISELEGIDKDQNTWDLSKAPHTWANVAEAFGGVVGH